MFHTKYASPEFEIFDTQTFHISKLDYRIFKEESYGDLLRLVCRWGGERCSGPIMPKY